MISEENVGKYFRYEDGTVWQLITFCQYPTATMRKVGAMAHEKGGAVGSLNLQGFKILHEPQGEVVEQVIDQMRGLK